MKTNKEQVCEWKIKVYDYPDLSQEIEYLASCGYALDVYTVEDYLGGKECINFCPSCGKRIRYEEEYR